MLGFFDRKKSEPVLSETGMRRCRDQAYAMAQMDMRLHHLESRLSSVEACTRSQFEQSLMVRADYSELEKRVMALECAPVPVKHEPTKKRPRYWSVTSDQGRGRAVYVYGPRFENGSRVIARFRDTDEGKARAEQYVKFLNSLEG